MLFELLGKALAFYSVFTVEVVILALSLQNIGNTCPIMLHLLFLGQINLLYLAIKSSFSSYRID